MKVDTGLQRILLENGADDMKKWKRAFCGITLGVFVMLCSCESQVKTQEKVKDCNYTVVEQEELPKELVELIEERKKEPFKLSFGEDGYLYIVRGYGKQAGGGYSISVEGLYETETQICLETNLIGPKEPEETKVETYPYIVVMMEYIDKDVVYQ